VALVLALGNPGARYSATRHNVGWRVAEELVRRWRAEPAEATPRYRAWRAAPEGREAWIVTPLTFMNLSGEALAEWRERHGLEIEALLVVSDDVYLPVGVVRLRARGSSGGHKGLESVEAVLGGPDYPRLRIGVGGVESERLKEHVLEGFTEEESRRVDESIGLAADAVETWSKDGLTAAMNRFNRRTGQEVPES
jgi:PTH1 family peptidyl-tRNA hydrolase